jgi:hypothetical protein
MVKEREPRIVLVAANPKAGVANGPGKVRTVLYSGQPIEVRLSAPALATPVAAAPASNRTAPRESSRPGRPAGNQRGPVAPGAEPTSRYDLSF